MTSREAERAHHEALAEALREAPPRLDDLRRARLERRVLAASQPGAAGHVGAAGQAGAAGHVGALATQGAVSRGARSVAARRRAWSTPAKVVAAVTALAAAAVLGFVVRGFVVGGALSHTSQAHFVVGSAFETREGTLTNGARLELQSGEVGRLAIGDVTGEVRDGGALEVRSIDPDDVQLVLERGTAELTFHPHARGRQHLRVLTPSAEVEVVGTVFSVRVDDVGTTVGVREGTVRVTRHSGNSRLVHAGESVTVPNVSVTAAATHDRRGASLEGHERGRETGAPDRGAAEAAMHELTAIELAHGPGTDAASTRDVVGGDVVGRDVMAAVSSEGGTQRAGALVRGRTVGAASGSSPRPSEGSLEGASVGSAERSSEATPRGTDTVSTTPEAAASASPSQGASELASPRAATPPAAVAMPLQTANLVAVHPRLDAVDSWAAHRPSSREIAAAWHDIDELQARGQFERSLVLLVRLERFAPPSDQDEALFDRARTVQEALRRPQAARALYSEYVRRFSEGRHLQEVRRRLEALGAPAEGDPAPDDVVVREGASPTGPSVGEPAEASPR